MGHIEPHSENEAQASFADKAILWLVFLFMIVAGVLGILKADSLTNTINGAKLYWCSTLLGIGIAVICALLIKKTRPVIYNGNRLFVYASLLVGWSLFCEVFATYINRSFTTAETTCNTYTVLNKNLSSRRGTDYLLVVRGKDDEAEFSVAVSKSVYDTIVPPEPIELCIQKGALGFEIVKEVNLLN